MGNDKFEDVIKEVKEKVVEKLKNKEQLMILLTPKRDDNFIRVEISRYREPTFLEPTFVDMEIRTNLILDLSKEQNNGNKGTEDKE